MDELDKKLDEVVTNSFSIWKAGEGQTTEDAPGGIQWFRPNGGELWFFDFKKADVKQAFIDAGWVMAPRTRTVQQVKADIARAHDGMQELSDIEKHRRAFHPPLSEIEARGHMTGQEWYDRFIFQLNREGTLAAAGIELIEDAAKKAAGIK